MINLQDLPVEILKNVMSYFLPRRDPLWETWESGIEQRDSEHKDDDDDEDDEDRSYEDLYKMCLVSKKFRDIAQPYLFLKFEDDGVLENMEETICFARCLYRNPGLGQYVQELSISATIPLDESDGDEDLGQYNPLTEQDIEILGKEHKAWIPAIKECDLSVLTALIVEKTPNLRRLVLPGGVFRMEHVSELMRQNPAILSKLERVAFMGNGGQDGYDIASYHQLLAISSLKLALFQHGDLQSSTFPSTWEPAKLSVEELAFKSCQIDTDSVKRLIRACKALKLFLFDDFTEGPLTQRDRNAYRGSQFNAADAHEALLGHKDTLNYLRLEFPRSESELNDWHRFLSSRVKIRPLSDFPVLRDIHLQQAMVPIQPKFSPAVKRLVIADANSSVINLVKNIAKDCKKGLYPDLAHFSMSTEDLTSPIQLPGQMIADGKTPYEAFEDLRGLFEGTGVDFGIRPAKMPDTEELLDRLGLGLGDDDDGGYYDDDIAYDSEGFEIDDPIGDAFRAPRGGRSVPGGGLNGPMPPGLLEAFMQRAMQDPDFAHIHSSIQERFSGGSRRPPATFEDDVWETDDSE